MPKDLDAIFSASKPGDVITLGPGTYTTLGVPTSQPAGAPPAQHLKRCCVLRGDPAGGTTIINVRPWDGDNTTILGDGDNIVEDITIDCGQAPAGTRWKRNGYYGDQKATTTLTRVHCIHPRGNFTEMRESFALCVSSSSTSRSIIKDCSVSLIEGDYSTCIQGGFLLNNRVIFTEPPVPNSRIFRVAYNMGGSDNARVINCTSRWANFGIYSDWMDCVGLKVMGCTFYGCVAGINANLQVSPTPGDPPRAVRDLRFEDNTILLNPMQKEVEAILLDHSTSDSVYRENTQNCINGALITGNRIEFLPGQNNCTYRYAINCASYTPAPHRSATVGITGVRFENNQVDPTLTYRNRSYNADITATNPSPTGPKPVFWVP